MRRRSRRPREHRRPAGHRPTDRRAGRRGPPRSPSRRRRGRWPRARFATYLARSVTTAGRAFTSITTMVSSCSRRRCSMTVAAIGSSASASPPVKNNGIGRQLAQRARRQVGRGCSVEVEAVRRAAVLVELGRGERRRPFGAPTELRVHPIGFESGGEQRAEPIDRTTRRRSASTPRGAPPLVPRCTAHPRASR